MASDERICPLCGVERTDYEGLGMYLPTCPACGARDAPMLVADAVEFQRREDAVSRRPTPPPSVPIADIEALLSDLRTGADQKFDRTTERWEGVDVIARIEALVAKAKE